MLQAKVRLARRERECELLQAKCSFVEHLSNELRARLEAYEAEELRRQSDVENEVRSYLIHLDLRLAHCTMFQGLLFLLTKPAFPMHQACTCNWHNSTDFSAIAA
jgi:hypothetical protein